MDSLRAWATHRIEHGFQLCRLSLQVLALLILLQYIAGCGSETVRAVDRAELAGREGFINDGRTRRLEVLERLGPANATFENGAILIYHVVADESGRTTYKQGTF